MSEKCKRLHEILEELPLVRYPFELEALPLNGIYFFYEEGEIWGHGGEKPRIVRVGTHRGGGNFRSRIAEHFLLEESRMDFDKYKPKPADRSIFRKNIGRALLCKNGDPYLSIWEIDFLPASSRSRVRERDVAKEKFIERQITDILRTRFSFRFIAFADEIEKKRYEGLEKGLVGTLARCGECRPSRNWLGNSSPKEQIRTSGLWQTQYVNADEMSWEDIEVIEELVRKTWRMTRMR